MPRKKTPAEPSGKIPLQFLTGSHPNDFKDSSARDSVRSHVMKDFRRRQSRSPRPRASSSQAGPRRARSGAKGRIRTRSMIDTPTPTLSPASQDFLVSFPPCEHQVEGRIQLGLEDSRQGPTVPTFIHPRLRDKSLCFKCLSSFTDKEISSPTAPPIEQSRLSLLGSICSEVVRRDLLLHNTGKSSASLAVQEDVMQSLTDTIKRSDDASDHETILAITYLIISATMQGASSDVDVHVRGFDAMAIARGGLQTLLSHSGVATVATAQILISKLLFETDMPVQAAMFPWSTDVGGSPLYVSISMQMDCPQQTSNILVDMQTLTDQSLADASSGLSLAQLTYKATTIWERLTSLPSAADMGSLDHEGKVYETVRIAALIYTTALLHGQPISFAISITADKLDQPTLLQDLCSALYSTNMSHLWGSLSQTLLWASLIGGAAAGSTNLQISAAEQARLRRYIFFPAMACINLLGTSHAHAFMSSLQTMLKVQRTLKMRAGGAE